MFAVVLVVVVVVVFVVAIVVVEFVVLVVVFTGEMSTVETVFIEDVTVAGKDRCHIPTTACLHVSDCTRSTHSTSRIT